LGRHATRVKDLAVPAGVDSEEALLRLWEVGVNVVSPDDLVARGDIARAREALGTLDPASLRKLSTWCRVWQLDDQQTRDRLLQEYGVAVASGARTLPKGAVRRILRTREAASIPDPVPPLASERFPEPEFVWTCRGRMRPSQCLTVDEVLTIHEALVSHFAPTDNPIEPAGVKSQHLLASAVSRPETSLGASSKYTTVEASVAALLHSIVHAHPFHNGNKRTAVVSALVMLDRNDILLTCTELELFTLVLKLAGHRLIPADWSMRDDREVLHVAEWILQRSRTIERGERLIRWHSLKTVLSGLGCQVIGPLKGNKLKIQREVVEKGILLRRRRTLTCTTGYRNSGQEVSAAALKDIRRKLELDDEHGYDSAQFYGSDKRPTDEFIAEFSTLLRRLARL